MPGENSVQGVSIHPDMERVRLRSYTHRRWLCNRSCVCAWYNEILRPHLRRTRFALGNEKDPAVLICDGFRSHDDAPFKEMAADGVRVAFIPLHRSNLTQPLEKFVFANLKRSYEQVTCLAQCNLKKIRRMMKLFCVFYSIHNDS